MMLDDHPKGRVVENCLVLCAVVTVASLSSSFLIAPSFYGRVVEKREKKNTNREPSRAELSCESKG